jgi:hypothetical protein
MRTLLIILLLPVMAWAETEDLECATTTTPDDWTNEGGANKVASVSDAVDANYIWESTDEEQQKFRVEQTSDIGESDVIDSVKTMWRGQDNGTGANKVTIHQYVGVNSNDGSDINLSTSWTDYEDNFALAPAGGSWTLAEVDSLDLQAHCTAVGALKQVRVTRLYARVYYTPATGGAYQGQVIIIGGD